MDLGKSDGQTKSKAKGTHDQGVEKGDTMNDTVKDKETKKKKFEELPEAIINQKKAYQMFSDNKEYDENNYDSEGDTDFLVKFDEELDFKSEIKGVDLVFLLDASGSMNPFFKGSKVFIRKVIRDAVRCITQYKLNNDDLLRVALVCYRDHPPQGKSNGNFTVDFTHEHKKFKEILKSINAKGGGDIPEAVLDGLDEVVNSLTWRKESEKLLFHILDSPPHGKEFGGEKDSFPEGCPCGKNYEDILSAMREKEIDYTIIKLHNSIDKMVEVFSNYVEIDVLTLDFERDNSKIADQSG